MKPIRIPLAGLPGNRNTSTSKDRYLKNCYPETEQDGTSRVVKRPGLNSYKSYTSGVGRGIFNWQDNLYSVVGTTLRKGDTSIKTLNNSTGLNHFTSIGTSSPKMVMVDGSEMWVIETNDTTTKVTDADFPTNLVDGVVYLDGYVFVMNTRGEIYNCALNDPTNWVATDFIEAEISPDGGVALGRYQNYVVAFGEWSTEFLYDAANATGSPLGRLEGTSMQLGCAGGDTIGVSDDTLLWVAQARSGGKSVAILDGFNPKIVSTKPIERLLDAEGNTISSARAFVVKVQGHIFYVLTLTTTNKTLVYDLIDNAWHEWTSYDGATESRFTGISFSEINNANYIQDEDNGKIYELDVSTYQDDSNTIKTLIRTGKFDGQTTMQKFLPWLEIIGERSASSATLNVRWTDDDYSTYTTNRAVDTSKRMVLTRCGRFKRRAFELSFENNSEMRLEALELGLDSTVYAEGSNP